MPKYAFAAVLVVALLGCSSGEQMATAEKEVAAFRQLWDAQQFDKIHANGSDALRKSVSEADLTKILGTIAARLGKVKSSKKSGWNINFQTSGTFVTLGFNTDFEKGAGTEQFVYHVSGNTAKLVSYNVNSPALLLN